MFWFGVVEDIDDPNQSNRYRVRIFDYHDDSVPTNSLPWALTLSHTGSASVDNIGDMSYLEVGSKVVVIFQDYPHNQNPIILGSINVKRSFDFKDLTATNEDKTTSRSVEIKSFDSTFDEPKIEREFEYGKVRTITSKSGHIIELCDIDGKERLSLTHSDKAGYIEIGPNGAIVIKGKSLYFETDDFLIKSSEFKANASKVFEINSASFKVKANTIIEDISNKVVSLINGMFLLNSTRFDLKGAMSSRLKALKLFLN